MLVEMNQKAAAEYVKQNFSEKEKTVFRALFGRFGGTLQTPAGSIKRRTKP